MFEKIKNEYLDSDFFAAFCYLVTILLFISGIAVLIVSFAPKTKRNCHNICQQIKSTYVGQIDNNSCLCTKEVILVPHE